MDADIAASSDVSANIQKPVSSEWPAKPLRPPSANTRTQAGQCESDEAEEGATFQEIELERDMPLKGVRICFEMDEDDLLPVA